MCEGFNAFFKNVATELAEKIPKPEKSFLEYLKKAKEAETPLELQTVSQEEVAKTISSFKPKVSSGYDNISYKTLKQITKYILNPLTFCLNKCIKESIFPSILKMSKILPLFKKGDKNLAKNYRPISMLSVFSQLLQKIINKQCNEFIISNELSYEKQFGFKEKNSTSHAMLTIINEIESGLNKKHYVLIINLDFSMGFDTVNTEEILPQKLRHYFKNENTCKMINSFLKERQQYIKIGKHESNIIDAKNIGTVQGSNLGAQLFSVYVTDLPEVTKNLSFTLFADDTTAVATDRNLKDLEKKVNQEMMKLRDYLNANRLSLNISKTTYSIFCPPGKKVKENIRIKIGNEEIQRTEEALFLGLILDTSLRFQSQFKKVVEKVKKGVNAIIMTKNTLTYQAKLKLYHSLVHSHLLYCNQIWLQKINAKEMNQLKVLQKRAIRALFNVKYNCHTNDLFELSGIVKVEDITKRENLTCMYLYKERLLPKPIQEMITKATSKHEKNTRSTDTEKLYINTGILKEDNTLFKMIDFWNKTQIEIKSKSYSLPTVRKRIDFHISQKSKTKCEKIGCNSCYCYDVEKLKKYMKH